MKYEKSSNLLPGIMLAALLSPLAMGCSTSGPSSGGSGGNAGSGGSGGTAGSGGSGSGGAAGSGGTTSSGGSAGSGGTAGSASSGGGAGSGGTTNSGGGPGTGGTKAAGGATGGGGAVPTGGTKATGGITGDGGITAAGGGTARGGATGNGGATARGGATGTGGAQGGATGGGGNTATGGATGAGGSTECAPPTVSLTGANAVANGPLITFNPNGGWCWYQDERAVVDVKGNKLVVGSVSFQSGNIEAAIYDLATKKAGTPAKIGVMSVDDHNAPALIVRPDGGYAAMWAGHNENCNSYFSTYNGTSWAAQKTFDWTSQGCPWSRQVTYANLWYLGTDLVSFVRSVDTSPSYLISKDNGASWTYGGRLTSTATVGYVAGYFKYWGNNTDRIDFVGTEAHPRDNDNSLYHGYVKDGKVYNSAGTVIDSTLADKTAQDITKYTKVFATGGTVGSAKITNAWNSDLVRYEDGTIGLIWTGRVGKVTNDEANTDLRLLYGRFDGTSWKLTYLVKAGPKLYADEQDYTGLGALHPDDPTTIYISTPYNPSTDTMASGAKREIWRGTTCDNGATFKWTPVTANSGDGQDNYRPIVPKWDAQHTALLWMRGKYETAQKMTMAIVGTITGP